MHVVTYYSYSLIHCVAANWVVWPGAQMVNFRFVPPALQVPFINVVVLGWSSYLAMKAAEPNDGPAPAPAPAKASTTPAPAAAADKKPEAKKS